MFNSKILNIIGLVLIFLSLSMIPSALWNISEFSIPNYYSDISAIVKSVLVTFSAGIILYIITKKSRNSLSNELTSKDGFIIVSLGWISMAIFSALPYYFSSYGFTYTDAFFESMSGLTTTGASILGTNALAEISDLSPALLFWRSFTHFIGGMGIIVFSIAILPLLGIGGVQLFRAEVAGPVAEKITPRVKQTAKLLWGIYVGFILIQSLILYLEGFTWHQSFCHSFATMATGGFSTFDTSIQGQPLYVQWTFIVFMFLAATNFTLHYFFIAKRKLVYFKDEEFKTYCFIFVSLAIIIFLNITFANLNKMTFQSFTDSTFTTISLLTTTGFGTVDFATNPTWSSSQIFIFFLFFIGGTAGSTTGGIKIIRTILVFKYLSYELKKLIHPKGVYNIRVGGNVVPDDVVKTTLGFYLFYIVIFVITACIFSIFGESLTTSLTASASSIGNIGPGLGSIGPADNWSHFPSPLKWVSALCMLLGRLEIFTVMVLFSRTFWKP